MPDLTISLTAAQVARVQKAFGHYEGDDVESRVWVSATAEEVAAGVKRLLQRRCFQHERELADAAANASVVSTLNSEWAE